MEENINKIIVSTLSATNLPTYFIMKPEHINQNDYITFNYIENDDWYSNDRSELSEYSVTLNFITTDLTNIIRNNELIKDTLKKYYSSLYAITKVRIFLSSYSYALEML